MPDLTVVGMGVQLETGDACGYTSTGLGLRVRLGNSGDGAAGPFVVEVNGSQQASAPGLGPGQEVSLWFPGYVYMGENTASVDATDLVAESDETNNTLTRLVPVPTLPPACTPTPSPTPTLSPSPTPVPASPTQAPANTPTPTATPTLPSPSATPTPSPSPAPVPASPTPTNTPPATVTTVPSPTSTAAPAGQPDVRIACIFFDGVVPRQETDEYVEIVNRGNATQDLKGWRLTDIDDEGPNFDFPSWNLEPGATVRVYTNEVHQEWGGFSFGQGSAVWNNSDPDTAGLFNEAGDLVSTMSYGDPPGCE